MPAEAGVVLGAGIGESLLAVVVLYDFIRPIIQQSVLNLGLAKAIGQFAFASGEQVSHGHGSGIQVGHHNIMRGGVQVAVGLSLRGVLVQLSLQLGVLVSQLGNVLDVSGDSGHGVLLHSVYLSGFLDFSLSFLHLYSTTICGECQEVFQKFLKLFLSALV